MSKPIKTITVGLLIEELDRYPRDAPLFFGSGDLSFYRVKNRGGDADLVQIEFGELYRITHDPDSDS